MQVCSITDGYATRITGLFTRTFAASEGPEEGTLIGTLADDLLATTPARDLRVLHGSEAGRMVACLMFSRLCFSDGATEAFLLAPVAVVPEEQGKGLGQALLHHGLDLLRGEGIDLVVTYGDPAFYGRVGFRPVAPSLIPAPFPLSRPEGWLAQSLTGCSLTPLRGPAQAVPAFDNSGYW